MQRHLPAPSLQSIPTNIFEQSVNRVKNLILRCVVFISQLFFFINLIKHYLTYLNDLVTSMLILLNIKISNGGTLNRSTGACPTVDWSTFLRHLFWIPQCIEKAPKRGQVHV